MADPEPGKNSSSRNVKISRLRIEGAEGRTLRVFLEDGSLFLFSANSAAAVLAGEIDAAGGVADENALAVFEAAHNDWLCRRKALELLNRAEQYRRGLEIKLLRRNFSRESVRAVLDEMEELGLLDDSRYAQSWARSRLRRSADGPVRLVAALCSRGIARSVASEAVASVLDEAEGDAVEAALERAWRKLSRKNMDNLQMSAALVRRGFAFSRVQDFLKQNPKQKQKSMDAKNILGV